MKKALFALILGLAAAPAALACSDPASCHQKNMNDWHYLNEVLPQELQRAQQQYAPVQYQSRYGTIAQRSDGPTVSINNAYSREQADNDVLAGCRARVPAGVTCAIAWRYANTCIAIVRNNGIAYVESTPSKWKAKRMAMKKCKAESGNPSACEHHMSECSLPVRIN